MHTEGEKADEVVMNDIEDPAAYAAKGEIIAPDLGQRAMFLPANMERVLQGSWNVGLSQSLSQGFVFFREFVQIFGGFGMKLRAPGHLQAQLFIEVGEVGGPIHIGHPLSEAFG